MLDGERWWWAGRTYLESFSSEDGHGWVCFDVFFVFLVGGFV